MESLSRLPSDDGFASVSYHSGRESFIIDTTTEPHLRRMWVRVSQWPRSRWDRKLNHIEVPALPVTAPLLLDLINIHNLEMGELEQRVLGDLDKAAKDNFTMTARIDGLPNAFRVNGTPFPYQVIGAVLGLVNKRLLIGDEPGLGKTIEGILMLSKLNVPAVIICPKNARRVWYDELLKWIPGMQPSDIMILRGSKAGRIPPTQRLVIVSYDILVWWILYLDMLNRDVFIVDEIHKLGKPNSKRSRAAYFLLRNATYRIGTTGTAAQNRPEDIIHPLDVLGVADNLGGRRFLMRRFGDAPKSDSAAELQAYAKSQVTFHTWMRQSGAYIRRTKASVRLQLPEKRREVVPIELTNMGEYRKAAISFAAWAERMNAMQQGGIRAWADLVVQQKLLNLGTEAEVLPTPEIMRYKDFPIALQGMARINTLKQLAFLGKLPAVKEWVDDLLESGQKLILFAWFKESQKILRELWPERMCATILGTDNERHRDTAIWRFQNDPNTRIIVCSIMAANEAITLTAANHVAHVEFPWTPSAMQQAEDRAHRIGQTLPVTCWNLVGLDTIETDIIELLSGKLEVLEHLIDGRSAMESPVINALLSTLIEKIRRDKTVQESTFPVYSGIYS